MNLGMIRADGKCGMGFTVEGRKQEKKLRYYYEIYSCNIIIKFLSCLTYNAIHVNVNQSDDTK